MDHFFVFSVTIDPGSCWTWTSLGSWTSRKFEFRRFRQNFPGVASPEVWRLFLGQMQLKARSPVTGNGQRTYKNDVMQLGEGGGGPQYCYTRCKGRNRTTLFIILNSVRWQIFTYQCGILHNAACAEVGKYSLHSQNNKEVFQSSRGGLVC